METYGLEARDTVFPQRKFSSTTEVKSSTMSVAAFLV